MTRDEALRRLRMAGLNDSWSEGLLTAFIALELFYPDEMKNARNKALEAYEEALQAQDKLDEIRSDLSGEG